MALSGIASAARVVRIAQLTQPVGVSLEAGYALAGLHFRPAGVGSAHDSRLGCGMKNPRVRIAFGKVRKAITRAWAACTGAIGGLLRKEGFWKAVQLALFTIIPALIAAWLGIVLSPVDLDGYWDARDPRVPAAETLAEIFHRSPSLRDVPFIGCVHIKQRWPRRSITASIGRNFEGDKIPEIVGTVESDSVNFTFFVINHAREKPELRTIGEGELVLTPDSHLVGIWKETQTTIGNPVGQERDSSQNAASRVSSIGRWRLIPRNRPCRGKAAAVDWIDRVPRGFLKASLRYVWPW